MANNTDWLNISQLTGGTGETALSLTALTNTSLQPKTATITARNTQYNVSDTTTVTIQGFQPTLTLSRSTLRFDSTGGTVTFTVYSNTAWTITFPSLVHSYSTSAGTGDTEVTVALAPNYDETGKIDTAIVKDVYNVNELYLTIVQESFISELTVTPDDDIVFANTGSSTSVTVDSNCDWEIVYPSWVVPSITSGQSGTTTVTFTAPENGPTDRSGEIIFYYSNKEIVIDASQPFYIPAYITVTPSSWEFNYTEDGHSFIVDSYPEWTGEIVSTGETVWDAAYIEAVYDIPSALTLSLYNGNSGSTTAIYVNSVRQYGATYAVPSAGVYTVRYEMPVGGTSPVSQGKRYLKELRVSDGVGAIQSSAFTGCSGLSSVTIGTGLTRIGDAAFSGCTALNNITITAPTAPSICANTFYNVATGGTLDYPAGSNYNLWLSPFEYYLGYYQWPGFNGKEYMLLEYNVTGNGETKIVNDSLEDAIQTKISRIELEDGTELHFKDSSSGIVVFPSTGIQRVKMYNSVQNTGKFFKNVSALTKAEISDTVTNIGYETFGRCHYLTSVTISNTVSVIEGAFAGCTSLTDIYIPNNVNTLTGTCFAGCTSLTSLTLPENITSLPDGMASYCLSLSSITIPSRVTSIGGSCFSQCSGLTNITIPNSVTTLGSNCFYQSGLQTITIPSSVTALGSYCFYECNSLTTANIENARLDNNCFRNCYNLSSVTFGSGVTNLDGRAFYNCRSLSLITCYGLTAPIVNWGGGYVFDNVAWNGVLRYPVGSDYSEWLSVEPHHLGYYEWTGEII